MMLHHKVITLAVIVIIVAAVAMPIIDDAAEESTLDVIIIAGQSNAEYTGDTDICNPEVLNAEYSEAPASRLMFFGHDYPANHWEWSTYYQKSWAAYHVKDMFDTDHYVIGGYEPIIANSVAMQTGNDVLVINTGIGARAIAELMPDSPDSPFCWGMIDRAIDQISSDYDTIRYDGVVWIQGEGDATNTVDYYKEQFQRLKAAYQDLGADKFYLVALRPDYGGNAAIAQNEIAANDSDVVMASTAPLDFTIDNGTLDVDAPIHYSQHGRVLIAQDVADSINISDNGQGYSPIYALIGVVLVITLVVVAIRFFIPRD